MSRPLRFWYWAGTLVLAFGHFCGCKAPEACQAIRSNPDGPILLDNLFRADPRPEQVRDSLPFDFEQIEHWRESFLTEYRSQSYQFLMLFGQEAGLEVVYMRPMNKAYKLTSFGYTLPNEHIRYQLPACRMGQLDTLKRFTEYSFMEYPLFGQEERHALVAEVGNTLFFSWIDEKAYRHWSSQTLFTSSYQLEEFHETFDQAPIHFVKYDRPD